jgi:GH25 family lysozyme M1 (1,4-beta-N-acetylmuramidase)
LEQLMPTRSRLSRTRLLASLAVSSALVAGGVGVASAPAAQADTARPVAGGPQEGMMPADSPDAVHTTTAPPSHSGTAPQEAGTDQATDVQATAVPVPGIDVSRYQHPGGAAIDWAKVYASGQRFAVVKATEYETDEATGKPVLFTNPNLTADLRDARAAGLVVGSYVFAHPDNSAITQADQFAAAVGELPEGSLPPVLDLEDDGGLTTAQLVAWTRTFLDRLQLNTGTVPMIYTGPNFWNTEMGNSTAFVNHPLWVAHYTDAAAPTLFGGWTSWSLWQYTNSGSVAGVTGPVDLNRFNGSSPAALAEPVQTGPLTAPATLAADRSLYSPSQQYRLDLQADGNLVEYGNGRALWSTGTFSGAGSRLDVQRDGNLVLYAANGRAVWDTRTYGSGSGNRLAVRDDGTVVLTDGSRVVWSNGAPGSDALSAGAALVPGQNLHSPSGQYRLDVQADGNLVEYGNGRALWSTSTFSTGGARLTVQPDGNLVLYSTSGVALWNTGTYGSGSSNRLVVQDDGNVVLYSGSRAVWHIGAPGSDTLSPGVGLSTGQHLHSRSFRYRLDVQPDGNLVQYDNGRAVWWTGTYAGRGTHLDVQTDGNLVLYSPAGAALWNTRTYGSGRSNRLVVQDDGNIVLYAGTRAVWSSVYG